MHESKNRVWPSSDEPVKRSQTKLTSQLPDSAGWPTRKIIRRQSNGSVRKYQKFMGIGGKAKVEGVRGML